MKLTEEELALLRKQHNVTQVGPQYNNNPGAGKYTPEQEKNHREALALIRMLQLKKRK